MTAAQLAESLCEMFTSKNGELVSKMVSRHVEVRSFHGDVLVRGRDVVKHLEQTAVLGASWPCGPALRLFLESDKPGAPSYSIDWYVAGRAPGLGPSGLAPPTERGAAVIVYKSLAGQLTCVWVGPDDSRLSSATDCTEEQAKESKEFETVMDLLVRPGELLGGTIAMHFNNYAHVVTVG